MIRAQAGPGQVAGRGRVQVAGRAQAGVGRHIWTAAGLLAAGAVYATVIERQWFALRRVTVPVLPFGAAPLTVLHLSDLHLLPRHRRKAAWVAGLDRWDPDLVVFTGDALSSADAIGPSLEAFGPLLDRPGAFVYGNNDFYAPEPKSPHRYFTRRTQVTREVDLPWAEFGAALVARGWADLNNLRASVTVGRDSGGESGSDRASASSLAPGTGGSVSATGLIPGARAGTVLGRRRVALAGVNDPHTGRDHYELVAGPADTAALVRIGVTHSPEPRVLDAFAADGYDVILAGHTHGGQVRIPGIGALVTNCGVDRSRARGLSRWGMSSWLNVSAGLGNSPYMPVRFACRPEATLLTLVGARK